MKQAILKKQLILAETVRPDGSNIISYISDPVTLYQERGTGKWYFRNPPNGRGYVEPISEEQKKQLYDPADRYSQYRPPNINWYFREVSQDLPFFNKG